MLRGRDGPCDASYGTPHTGHHPKSPRYTFCQWWTSVYSGSTRRGLETFKSLFLCRSTKIKHPSLQKRLTINNGTSWWNSKEKHFLYLHWKWNDRDDTRSIVTVLLLHFISDTRVEQVANEVYRASQGWRPGCLDWDAEAGSFSPYLPPGVSVVAFGL